MAIVKVLCGHCGMEFSFDTMHETLLNDEPTTIYCPFCIQVVGKVNLEPKFTPSMNERKESLSAIFV